MNEEITNDQTTSQASENKKGFVHFIKTKLTLSLLFLAIIAIVIIWFWKNHQINNVKESSQQQINNVKETSQTQFTEKQSETLKLFAKPYVWAVRKEMLIKNYQQVNLYASDMIHENNFQSIMISDAEGIIISSTDKKFEGQQLKTIVKPEYLSSDSTTIHQVNDSLIILNSPIMGFNSKLGVLTVYRKIDKLKF